MCNLNNHIVIGVVFNYAVDRKKIKCRHTLQHINYEHFSMRANQPASQPATQPSHCHCANVYEANMLDVSVVVCLCVCGNAIKWNCWLHSLTVGIQILFLFAWHWKTFWCNCLAKLKHITLSMRETSLVQSQWHLSEYIKCFRTVAYNFRPILSFSWFLVCAVATRRIRIYIIVTNVMRCDALWNCLSFS